MFGVREVKRLISKYGDVEVVKNLIEKTQTNLNEERIPFGDHPLNIEWYREY